MSETKLQGNTTVNRERTLAPADIEMMKEIKEVSRAFVKKLEFLEFVHEGDRKVMRWLAIARTDMQTACMAACRAVEQSDDGC